MRRRIVLINVTVSIITLMLFVSVALSTSAARIVASQRGYARVDADRIATGLDARIEQGQPISAAALAGFVRSDETVDVRLLSPTGAVTRTFELGSPSVKQHVVASSDLGGTVEVTVHTAGDSFMSALLRVGLYLVLIALVVVGVAALVGRRLAESLVEPVRDLAAAAARLGAGDPRPARRRYGIQELDAVAEVLDVSAQRIGEQFKAERQLAADVSHQLRTPLTALSMRLEEVIATDDQSVVRSEANIALQQVERLSGVVDDLLAVARPSRTGQTDVDVDAVLGQQLDEWRGAFTATGRPLDVTGERQLSVRVSAGALSQVVATLLENALVHGEGAVTVRTRTTGPSVVIEVSDEGPGVPTTLVRRIFDREVSGASRSGLGLAVARALTEVEGGRLELIHARPATFAVFLAASETPLDDSLSDDSASDDRSGDGVGSGQGAEASDSAVGSPADGASGKTYRR